ncbi:MAG: hypothetical protein J6V72_19880 [Kiritimatiellae bacterium]|nr:hypothetical protein [Kiritimatiellia bacterium]
MDSIVLDSIHCDILIPAHVAAKLKKRAAERNVSISHYINVILFSHTHNDPWTDEHEKERKKIIADNKKLIAQNTSSAAKKTSTSKKKGTK